ncbi:MAG TPA: hypothetical protein VFB28_04585 [Terriglobales bacterium]|nr:hypothetical protein [Terriglobales bacterium]
MLRRFLTTLQQVRIDAATHVGIVYAAFCMEVSMKLSRLIWLFVLAMAPAALAQGTYSEIDFPGAFSTYAVGIDKAGDVSGWFKENNGDIHGFLLRNGTYTRIDYPGTAEGTQLGAMNDLGQIVGVAGVTFIFDMNTGTFTDINSNLSPSALNNSGVVVGQVNTNGGLYGYVLKGTKGMVIEPPQTFFGMAAGISTSGDIVGYASGSSGNINFEYSKGKYSLITIPNITSPVVYGINPAGTLVVGSYASGTSYAGFVYDGKTLTSLQYNGADTVANTMNDSGQVVGIFGYDSTNNIHGFVWTPRLKAAKK